MTIDELRDRIKAEIILHEGDVLPYQWRQVGLVQEAGSAGLSEGDFFNLVNQVSLGIQSDFGRIADLKRSILTRLNQRRGKLTPADIDTLADEAERARLSRSFLTETWLPVLQRQVSFPEPASEPTRSEPTIATTPPAPTPAPVSTAGPTPTPVSTAGPSTAGPASETAESMRRKVTDSLNDYGDRIPAPAIRSLFRTISYDEAELAVAIWHYLQIERYQPVTELQEGSLREKLTATDWQLPRPARPATPPLPDPEPVYVSPVGLSEPTAPIVHSFTATPARVMRGKPVTLEWDVENLLAVTIDDLGEGLSPKNRGWIKPKKTADYTLFDVNNNPLSTVRVEVIPPDRSGLYGVLFALVLLLLIYWFVRGSASGNDADTEETTRQEQTQPQAKPTATDNRLSYPGPEPAPDEPTTEPRAEPIETTATDTKVAEPATEKPEETKSDASEPEPAALPAPVTPRDARRGKYEEAFGDKPYDKVELGDDERGWRRARKNGRWGYIDANDKWAIEPEFDAVTPFKGNTAAAFMNGQLITIDRDGRQVRN